MVNSFPTLCGSIASKTSPLGVALHNSAYDELGENFTYISFGVTNTEDAVRSMRSLFIRGLGVSMPHKIAIMQYLDSVDDIAKKIGSVNTVVNNNGTLIGYNTDWIGAIHALQEKIDIRNIKNSVVVGAGGVARAIVFGLNKYNTDVTIYNRTIERGKQLARDFGVKFGGGLNDLRDIDNYDLLINATSVGFNAPNDSIIPFSILKKNKVILDVIFMPPASKLINDAIAKECMVISGVRMLIHQAIYQVQLYTGKKPSFKVMEKALLNTIADF